jgi:hypothetical protein
VKHEVSDLLQSGCAKLNGPKGHLPCCRTCVDVLLGLHSLASNCLARSPLRRRLVRKTFDMIQEIAEKDDQEVRIKTFLILRVCLEGCV